MLAKMRKVKKRKKGKKRTHRPSLQRIGVEEGRGKFSSTCNCLKREKGERGKKKKGKTVFKVLSYQASTCPEGKREGRGSWGHSGEIEPEGEEKEREREKAQTFLTADGGRRKLSRNAL